MPRATTIALFATALFSLGGCASRSSALSQRTTITSAELQTGYHEAEAAAEDVSLGKYTDALARADNAVRLAPRNPWALYNRAAALHHLGRADDAVAAYQNAEVQFGEDRWGRSLAIYGRARALDDVGRCDEAKTAYEQFAALVRSHDAPAADMALRYASQCRATQEPPSPEGPLVTDMARALRSGNYSLVLELKDKLPPAAAPNPWVDYNVGAAFAALGKTDEAIAAYERAERQFGDRDRWGRSVAIWGRARALDIAGRCAEAAQAVEDYARVVGGSDPHSVRTATSYASSCP
ncbi:MAG: tetratricopeptide repeat protein [Labilithrix sp.]|nr:tetratricopeptide repeat protein [Labilithrix sp.]MBX3219102.1 tetratricopeptide repeat protein [Labilithrix sp.]